MNVAGARVLVAGGAHRVGRVVALGLAAGGADVAISYFSSAAAAETTRDEIAALGRRTGAFQANAAMPEDMQALVEQAAETLGGLDGYVHAPSGGFVPIAPEETDEALWDHTLAVNLKAPFFLIRHLAPTLRERRGQVVNLCDLAGLQAWGAYAAHAVSKAGLVHLTKVAARTLAPAVRVNGIAPGYMATELTVALRHDAARYEAMRARMPMGRWGAPDDLAGTVVYLASQASRYVSGSVIAVDGGWLVR
jgi:NAD(P)-dependent dehydrogenase (short-subunit alcohol dehydrogenase family)